MSVTDWKFPGTAGSALVDNSGAWTNYDYAKADDTSYASDAPGASKSSLVFLSVFNFGFSSSDIPSGATINGIEFIINRYANNANMIEDCLLRTILGTSGNDRTQKGDNLPSATKWPTSLTDATYGGATSLFNTTWTQSNILDSSFGILLELKCAATASTGYVDYIKIRVYYTAGGGASVWLPFMKHHLIGGF